MPRDPENHHATRKSHDAWWNILTDGRLCLCRNNTLSPLYTTDTGAVWNVELLGTRYLLPPAFVNLPCPNGADTLDAGCLPAGGYCSTGVNL
jgi:hypothetical protein